MVAYAPLHDEVALRELESNWITLCEAPWRQCVDDVKDYFGEKIGLYFFWLSHYTSFLCVASVMGVIAYGIVQAEDNDPNAYIMPYFAGAMAIWATLYCESFKRHQSVKAMQWGMTNYEVYELPRPDFDGFKGRDPVTGAPSLYYPRELRLKQSRHAYLIILASLSIIIGCLALIFFVRFIMQYNTASSPYATVVTSILTGLEIEALNAGFSKIAIELNDSENWRTDTDYEDALISKSFFFQFVNAFASLFYV
jgi:anoctamin-10/anoctamin-7